MQPTCPDCGSDLVKKNGHTRHGKQNHRCLTCDKQFVVDPEDHKVDERTKNLIRKTLLERVSLQGICRIFEISMPWLLGFIESIITQLPEDLNAEVLQENDDIETPCVSFFFEKTRKKGFEKMTCHQQTLCDKTNRGVRHVNRRVYHSGLLSDR